MTSESPGDTRLVLKIAEKKMLTDDICLFELRDPAGGDLPPFTAGAHVTVETPRGANRRYSLCNDPAERDRYVLAIKRERDGRGGSVSLVEETAEGGTLAVSMPASEFPLVDAPSYLLIAGGIGITPILSMARHLLGQGNRHFHLVYCSRSPEAAAFLDVLSAPEFEGLVTVHHDGGDPDRVYDFWDHLETPGKTHVYCCGPTPLMDDIRDMSGHWPPSQIHFEDFGGEVEISRADDKPFTVTLARSGEKIEIPADATILDTLRASGHRVPSSCETGTCGTCKTRLLSGVADHRDMVLTDEERPHFIMICVSRAADGELELDL